jgi:hypothetical protein
MIPSRSKDQEIVAGALSQWGFTNTNKKDFPGLSNSFMARISKWLLVSPELRALLVQNRDGFDALVASFVARAAALANLFRQAVWRLRRLKAGSLFLIEIA